MTDKNLEKRIGKLGIFWDGFKEGIQMLPFFTSVVIDHANAEGSLYVKKPMREIDVIKIMGAGSAAGALTIAVINAYVWDKIGFGATAGIFAATNTADFFYEKYIKKEGYVKIVKRLKNKYSKKITNQT